MADIFLPDGGVIEVADRAGIAKLEQLRAEEEELAIIRSLPDDELIERICDFQDERRRIEALLRAMEDKGKAEIERRITERGGTAFPPHPKLEKCELKDEWSTYAFDLPELNKISRLLPEAEAAKIIKHVPEKVVVEPAHDEPGAAVSITALIRKYGEGSEIGQRLKFAMRRDHLGKKLDFKRAPATAPVPQ